MILNFSNCLPVTSEKYNPNTDYYEWQKGMGANASDANTIPELKNFKTAKKTSFVDDEVPKGVRVFYRVRAANKTALVSGAKLLAKCSDVIKL